MTTELQQAIDDMILIDYIVNDAWGHTWGRADNWNDACEIAMTHATYCTKGRQYCAIAMDGTMPLAVARFQRSVLRTKSYVKPRLSEQTPEFAESF